MVWTQGEMGSTCDACGDGELAEAWDRQSTSGLQLEEREYGWVQCCHPTHMECLYSVASLFLEQWPLSSHFLGSYWCESVKMSHD